MHFQEGTLCEHPQINIDNLLPRIGKEDAVKSILEGLSRERKTISSMFFYDEVGSKLFEEITRLPEYYPTRTEKPLIRRAAESLRDRLRDTDIIEYGSGDCSKISLLLEAVSAEKLSTIRYVPVDVSHSAVRESAEILLDQFCGMSINGVLADFVTQAELVPCGERRVFCLFGGTIGNLDPEDATGFCRQVARIMGPEDLFLMGADKVKDRVVLHAAYNDSQNVTAEFNHNILNVVNNLTGTDFQPELFDHVAFFNEAESRIEMHLEASRDMDVYTPELNEPIRIRKGERIHTENSYKFTDDSIRELAESAGMVVDAHYTDERRWFSLYQFKTKS